MRGVVLREFGQAYAELRFDPTEPADLGPESVAIEVAACGLNFPDLLVVQGSYQTLPELPFVPGKELAGTIVAVGSAVRRFAVGDRVMAQVEHGALPREWSSRSGAASRFPTISASTKRPPSASSTAPRTSR